MTKTTEKRPSGVIRANCCETGWTGRNVCHCSGCCKTFTGPTAFNRHRRAGKCLTPEDAGLVAAPRWFECYGSPSDDARFDVDA